MSTTSPPKPTKKQRIAALEAEVQRLALALALLQAEQVTPAYPAPWVVPTTSPYGPWVGDFPQGTVVCYSSNPAGKGLQA